MLMSKGLGVWVYSLSHWLPLSLSLSLSLSLLPPALFFLDRVAQHSPGKP
jgi:hypothetical protein